MNYLNFDSCLDNLYDDEDMFSKGLTRVMNNIYKSRMEYGNNLLKYI